MARGKNTRGRSAALALRAPASSGTSLMEDTMAVVTADWMGRVPAPVAAPAIRRERRGRALLAAGLCVATGAAWLGTGATPAAATPGQPAAADCTPGIELGLETAPPATLANDGSATQRYSFTICARQSVQRIQARIARLKDANAPARGTNLIAITPAEVVPDLYGTRSWEVPAAATAGAYAVEISYFTPDGALADRAASVFRVSDAPAPAPPPGPAPVSTPGPAPIVIHEPAPPVATPRAEAPKRAVLRLTKRAKSGTVRPRGVVDWTLVVRNAGPAAARSVKVCDTLPTDLYFVASRRSHMEAGKVCWSVGTLAKGGSRKFTLRTRATNDITTTRLITNRAIATASNASSVRAAASVAGIGVTRPNHPGVMG